MGKKSIVEQSKADVKRKQLKNKETNMKKPIILTVILTLLVVAAFVSTFLAGMDYQKSVDENVKTEAQALSQELQVKQVPSKQ